MALALLTTRPWEGSWQSHLGDRNVPAALHRSIIMTLYLSSPPSGCNPDSDPSPLSLSPGGGHRAVGINLAWYFNADTS